MEVAVVVGEGKSNGLAKSLELQKPRPKEVPSEKMEQKPIV